MRKSRLAIAILAAAVLACIEPAANPQNRRSQPAQQVAPFDITRAALPPNYQGLNIETLFKQLSLRSAKLAKREFETTEQYQQRLQQQDSSWLRDDFINAASKYKESLAKTLAFFEESVKNAEDKLEHARLSGNPTLVKDAQSYLEAEQAKVERTQRLIAVADKQISQELFNSQSAPIVPDKDLLAFAINRNAIESEYNADDQSLRVAIDVRRVLGATSIFKDLYTLDVKTTFTNEASYMGTNAFGVRTRVSSYRSDGYELAYTNTGDFAVSRYVKRRYRHLPLNGDDALLFQLRMDVATAIKAKSNLRALAIVRSLPPYVSEHAWYTRPTLNSPTSAYNFTHYLKTYLVGLWLYDIHTGHIYTKVRPGTLDNRVPVIAAGPKQKVWIEFENGSRIAVDDAWERGNEIWYTRGGVTGFFERARVKGIVRKPSP